MRILNAIHGRLKRMAYRLLLPAVRSSCRCWNGGEGDVFGFLCRRSDTDWAVGGVIRLDARSLYWPARCPRSGCEWWTVAWLVILKRQKNYAAF